MHVPCLWSWRPNVKNKSTTKGSFIQSHGSWDSGAVFQSHSAICASFTFLYKGEGSTSQSGLPHFPPCPLSFLLINDHFLAWKSFEISHLWVNCAVVSVGFSTAHICTPILEKRKANRRWRRLRNERFRKTVFHITITHNNVTSKHAHKFGPPTLQSWHWPWNNIKILKSENKNTDNVPHPKIKLYIKSIKEESYMWFLNKFLLGDLPHTVQVGAVTTGRRWHHSPTGLRNVKEKE